MNGYEQIMRYAVWLSPFAPCSGIYVRDVCIFGVADLRLMANTHFMFVNKFYYNYQPMALSCLEERHYNMTREDILGLNTDRVHVEFYRNLPNVKQHIPSGLEY